MLVKILGKFVQFFNKLYVDYVNEYHIGSGREGASVESSQVDNLAGQGSTSSWNTFAKYVKKERGSLPCLSSHWFQKLYLVPALE